MESVTKRNEDNELTEDLWPKIRRMFDYLEANAGEYFRVPDFEGFRSTADLPSGSGDPLDDELDEPHSEVEEDEEENLFRSAYENVTFRDSADDGVFGETADDSYAPGTTEFEIIGRFYEPHLKFLNTVAHLWQMAAASIASIDIEHAKVDDDRDTIVKGWLKHLQEIQDQLRVLMDDIWEIDISTQAGDLVTNLEYDMQLQSKFMLLHNVIATSVNCIHAQRLLHCCLRKRTRRQQTTEELIVDVCRGVFQRDPVTIKYRLPDLLQQLQRQPLLYVPLENGGHPMLICKARALQSLMRFLVTQLPCMGLLQEARQVLQEAYKMERLHRPTGLAVTEFDRLFRSALRDSLQYIIRTSKYWRGGRFEDSELVDFVREVVDHYGLLWTLHSNTMRLSRIEELNKNEELAEGVQEFIERYGADLFHARMLTIGNIRTMLHHGMDHFLEQLEEQANPWQPQKLIDDLEDGTLGPGRRRWLSGTDLRIDCRQV